MINFSELEAKLEKGCNKAFNKTTFCGSLKYDPVLQDKVLKLCAVCQGKIDFLKLEVEPLVFNQMKVQQ